jgi:hypothetical protein
MERVTRKIVRIERPFRLGEENNPAGDYEVTTYEEPLGDLMYDAFRRISTKIYLPPDWPGWYRPICRNRSSTTRGLGDAP